MYSCKKEKEKKIPKQTSTPHPKKPKPESPESRRENQTTYTRNRIAVR